MNPEQGVLDRIDELVDQYVRDVGVVTMTADELANPAVTWPVVPLSTIGQPLGMADSVVRALLIQNLARHFDLPAPHFTPGVYESGRELGEAIAAAVEGVLQVHRWLPEDAPAALRARAGGPW